MNKIDPVVPRYLLEQDCVEKFNVLYLAKNQNVIKPVCYRIIQVLLSGFQGL